MQYLESIIDSGLLNELKKSDYMDAFEQLKISGRNYKSGETVFFEGDIIDKFCIVKKGSVRSEKTYLNGEVHIVDLFDEGSVFGLAFALSKSRITALDFVSNEESEIVFVSMHSMRTKSGSDTVTIRMSREQLAQYLCVNRSALSNELSKMKKDGIIDFKGSRFTLL